MWDLGSLSLTYLVSNQVNRQNFRHLVKEASIRWLEAGDTYAVEDVTPADERLSVLLTGKWVYYIVDPWYNVLYLYPPIHFIVNQYG